MSDIPRAALPDDMIEAAARAAAARCPMCNRSEEMERHLYQAQGVLEAAGVPALLEERDRLRAQLLDLVSKSHDADTFDVCTCDGENECEGCRAGQAWRAAYSAVRDGD